MTAHDVVARVRKLAGIKQVGHAGTLDPMATGVLPVALGRACRLLRFLADDKTYEAGILFGVSTDTDDIEGRIIKSSTQLPARDEIESALLKFTGEIEQVPPLYSAVHVNGERLYRLARRGETNIEIPARRVQIHKIDLLDYLVCQGLPAGFPNKYRDEAVNPDQENNAFCQLDLRIHCGSGTYIRSIARDLGNALGSAACLYSLKRVQSGPFNLEKSISLAELKDLSLQGKLSDQIEPVEEFLALPKLELNADLYKRISFGQQVKIDSRMIALLKPDGSCLKKDQFVLALSNQKAVAVCSIFEKSEPDAVTGSYIVELKPEVVLVNGSSN